MRLDMAQPMSQGVRYVESEVGARRVCNHGNAQISEGRTPPAQDAEPDRAQRPSPFPALCPMAVPANGEISVCISALGPRARVAHHPFAGRAPGARGRIRTSGAILGQVEIRVKKIWQGLCLASVFVCASVSAQDALKSAPDASRLLFENEYIRVIELTFEPGTQVGPYSHPAGWYYVTQAGKVRDPGSTDKDSRWEPEVGEQGWGNGEPPHVNESYGDRALKYIYVEVKAAPTKHP